MTAPPTQMPLPVFADHLALHAASPLSSASASASAASHSPSSWSSNFMYPNAPSSTPRQRQSQPPKSKSPPTNENNGLLFITGNTPAELKSKKNMRKVRKKAMGSYLEEKEKDKKPRNSPWSQRSRNKSEGSTGSRASIEDDDFILSGSNSDALNMERGDYLKSTRRPSSPVPSPASSNDHQATEQETHISRVRQSIDMILPSAPMVTRSRTHVKLEYDETPLRPFQSIGKPLDPFRTMFQAHHPRISVEELKFHCSRVFGTRAMGQYWIPTLVKSPHAFLSTLCIASAHLDAIKERPIESVQTLALRQEVIHLIGQNLVNPNSRVDDFNIIALTQLIASEIIAGEETALTFHESGVTTMVKQRGGVSKLGVNGRLASSLSWVSLESAILRESTPQSIYTDYCTSTSSKTYPNTATIPESPLFCPREDFETIKRSQRCTPKSLELLRDMRMMIDFSMHETEHSRQNGVSLKNLFKRIMSRPSTAELQKTNVLTSSDWTYEAIRVAAVLQATSLIDRSPLSEALKSAAQRRPPTQIYTSSSLSKSNESLVSPLTTFCHDSPMTSFSTSPSYATSPAFPTNPFTYVPSRPSISSSRTSSSDNLNHAFFPQPSAPVLSGPATLLNGLKTAIQNSNLSDCWADMAGVLFWISLVGGAASRKSDKVTKKWFAALAMRCSIMLCFEHQEPVHASLLRMCEVVESVGIRGAHGGQVGRIDGVGSSEGSTSENAKRRRV